MLIESCQTYQAQLDDFHLVRMADGKSSFKIYYCSITGRNCPERYEWSKCALNKEQFAEDFSKSGYDGIGFLTAFPHIVKVFRFAPQNETLEYVCAFKPEDWNVIKLERGDGYYEYACFAEAILAAEEFRFWSSTASVEEYLRCRCQEKHFDIRNSSKLKQYWMS